MQLPICSLVSVPYLCPGSSGFLLRKPFQNFDQVMLAAVFNHTISQTVLRHMLGFAPGTASGPHNPGCGDAPFGTPDVLPYPLIRPAGDGTGVDDNQLRYILVAHLGSACLAKRKT